jgi:Bacterial HORMA domain family 1
MSDTTTNTVSETYSVVDVETVARRFTADLVMIAQSSAAITEETARLWAHDVEALAKKGYLKMVDLTLLSGDLEHCATHYSVNTASGNLTMSRPGGVMWPRISNAQLRIVLSYTSKYTAEAKEEMRHRLKLGWVPSYDDTSHAALKATGARDYASNAFGMQRKDFAS